MLKQQEASLWDRLRGSFVVGVLTIAPLALTLYILITLGRWFDALFQPIFDFFLDRAVPGAGIVLGVAFILVVGWLAPSLIGKQLFRWTDTVVARIPLAKVIYSAARQIFEAFSHTTAEKFRRVVMIPFPREGSYVVAFVTREVENGWVPGKPGVQLSAFIPTTPNPTSGYLVFVDAEDAIPLDMSIEEGLKLVISGGLAKPSYLGSNPPEEDGSSAPR